MADIIHPAEKKSPRYDGATSPCGGDKLDGWFLRFFFCPVRGFSVINPPRIFPEIAAVVLLATGAEWFMVMSGGDCSSSTSSDLLSSPWRFLFFLSFFFLSLKWMWITVCLFHFMLEWQQLYPQCVPISPFRAVGSGVGAGAAEGPRGTSCCSHKAGPPLIMLLR